MCLPSMQESRVQSLGWEDPLEKEMVTHSLPGEFHGQRSLVGYSPWGHKELDTTEWLTHTIVTSEHPISLEVDQKQGLHVYVRMFSILEKKIQKIY